MTEKKRFKLIDNHLIMYDGDYFDLHKPSDIRSLIKVLNYVTDEKQQLQERNNRQAKQLDNLYQLIEKKDWEALIGIIEEFKQCDEQLQYEWRREFGWSMDSYSE